MFENCFRSDDIISCISSYGNVDSWDDCKKKCNAVHLLPFNLAMFYESVSPYLAMFYDQFHPLQKNARYGFKPVNMLFSIYLTKISEEYLVSFNL